MNVLNPFNIISFLIFFFPIAIPITVLYLLYKIYRKLEKLENK